MAEDETRRSGVELMYALPAMRTPSSASSSNAPARLTIIASRTRYGLLHYLDREESIIDHFLKVFAPRCDLQGELLDVKR
jgi:hypothetical protein